MASATVPAVDSFAPTAGWANALRADRSGDGNVSSSDRASQNPRRRRCGRASHRAVRRTALDEVGFAEERATKRRGRSELFRRAHLLDAARFITATWSDIVSASCWS